MNGVEVEEIYFLKKINGELSWYEDGDGSRDGKYVGKVKNGKPNGSGILTFTNGNKYEGSFKDGKYDYFGLFTWNDGSIIHGVWKDNKPWNTSGTYLKKSGEKLTGVYKDGKKWNISKFDKSEKLSKKWVNGKEKKLIPNDFVKKNIKWMEIIQNLNNNLILDSNNLKIHQTKINFTKSFKISLPKVDDSIPIRICNFSDSKLLPLFKIKKSTNEMECFGFWKSLVMSKNETHFFVDNGSSLGFLYITL